MKALAEARIDAAVGAGASYADARAVSLRRQYVITKNGHVDDLSDGESEGIGVRVLVDGAWGFAGEGRLDDGGARHAALRACRIRAGRARPARRPSWHRSTPQSGSYRTPMERDPSTCRSTEKIELCLRAEEGMRRPKIKVTLAWSALSESTRCLLTSDGVEHRAGARRVRRRDRRLCRRGRRHAGHGAIRASTPGSAGRAAGSSSRSSASTERRRASASRQLRS